MTKFQVIVEYEANSVTDADRMMSYALHHGDIEKAKILTIAEVKK